MRKEVIIAIILGSVLGIAVAFGIWRANQTLKPQKQIKGIEATSSPVSTTQPENKTNTETAELLITSPENNIVVNEDSVKVEGTTQPKATIVIISNTGEVILEAKQDGSFEQNVKLEGGANEIKVVAYDKNGRRTEKIITVVYSTELEFPPTGEKK